MRIVMLAHDSPEADVIVGRFLERCRHEVVALIRSETIIAGKSTFQAYRHLARRSGFRLLYPKGLETAVCAVSGAMRRAVGRRPRVRSLRGLAREHGIECLTTRAIHSADTLDQLHQWAPDLLVSVYLFDVLRRSLLETARLGAINYHPALLPRNRGLVPYVWALSNGERQTGGTVHWIDDQVDTGDVILQRAVPIRDDDTAFSLAYRCADLGGDLLVEAVDRIAAGEVESTSQNHAEASYYSWPDRQCLAQLKRRGRSMARFTEMVNRFLIGHD